MVKMEKEKEKKKQRKEELSEILPVGQRDSRQPSTQRAHTRVVGTSY